MINSVNNRLIEQHLQKIDENIIIESVGFIKSNLSVVTTTIVDPTVDTTELKSVLESVSTDGLFFKDACSKIYECANKN